MLDAGVTTGGVTTGGVTTGGVTTGGVTTGGVTTGGVTTGGVTTGGVTTGGVTTGGVTTGGVTAGGGVTTGGVATGGSAGANTTGGSGVLTDCATSAWCSKLSPFCGSRLTSPDGGAPAEPDLPTGSSLRGGTTLSGASVPPDINCGTVWPRLICSICPTWLAASSRLEVRSHGPLPPGMQVAEKPLTTMAPEITVTRDVSSSVETVKSVPRTPMAATGVLKRKFCRASLTASPETLRATPDSNSNLMWVLAGFWVSTW